MTKSSLTIFITLIRGFLVTVIAVLKTEIEPSTFGVVKN